MPFSKLAVIAWIDRTKTVASAAAQHSTAQHSSNDPRQNKNKGKDMRFDMPFMRRTCRSYGEAAETAAPSTGTLPCRQAWRERWMPSVNHTGCVTSSRHESTTCTPGCASERIAKLVSCHLILRKLRDDMYHILPLPLIAYAGPSSWRPVPVDDTCYCSGRFPPNLITALKVISLPAEGFNDNAAGLR